MNVSSVMMADVQCAEVWRVNGEGWGGEQGVGEKTKRLLLKE